MRLSISILRRLTIQRRGGGGGETRMAGRTGGSGTRLEVLADVPALGSFARYAATVLSCSFVTPRPRHPHAWDVLLPEALQARSPSKPRHTCCHPQQSASLLAMFHVGPVRSLPGVYRDRAIYPSRTASALNPRDA